MLITNYFYLLRIVQVSASAVENNLLYLKRLIYHYHLEVSTSVFLVIQGFNRILQVNTLIWNVLFLILQKKFSRAISFIVYLVFTTIFKFVLFKLASTRKIYSDLKFENLIK